MQFGASTFIWVSPFSNRTLELMDRAKAMGFDILEICIEDPDTIDVPAIRAKAAANGHRRHDLWRVRAEQEREL